MIVRQNCSRTSLFFVAVLLLVTPAAHAITQDSFSAAIQRFENQNVPDVAADCVGAISAAIVLGNSVVWARGFGLANTDLRTPAGVETIYRTGSISKTFTAVLLMQLVERGVLALDDPVVDHLPEFGQLSGPEEQVRSITFRQLASSHPETVFFGQCEVRSEMRQRLSGGVVPSDIGGRPRNSGVHLI